MSQNLNSAVAVIGIDIGKNSFHVIGLDHRGVINPPRGCHFHTRCPYAVERCRLEVPALREVKPGHLVACHLR